ncbi:hypothetical protein F5883DRAFT_180760 [Diaporthe sp. PMI_573]|nr:hypothetical protein F5883DRAFT_180760 [Diaporthaceae sp. PMI_573]
MSDNVPISSQASTALHSSFSQEPSTPSISEDEAVTRLGRHFPGFLFTDLVDLTYEGAENGTAIKPLPFRPEDLARFTSNSDIGQWLNDEIINTLFERIVGLRENLRTASSGIWLVEGKPLPCEPPTVFILPVHEAKHWVLLTIDVEVLFYV